MTTKFESNMAAAIHADTLLAASVTLCNQALSIMKSLGFRGVLEQQEVHKKLTPIMRRQIERYDKKDESTAYQAATAELVQKVVNFICQSDPETMQAFIDGFVGAMQNKSALLVSDMKEPEQLRAEIAAIVGGDLQKVEQLFKLFEQELYSHVYHKEEGYNA